MVSVDSRFVVLAFGVLHGGCGGSTLLSNPDEGGDGSSGNISQGGLAGAGGSSQAGTALVGGSLAAGQSGSWLGGAAPVPTGGTSAGALRELPAPTQEGITRTVTASPPRTAAADILLPVYPTWQQSVDCPLTEVVY